MGFIDTINSERESGESRAQRDLGRLLDVLIAVAAVPFTAWAGPVVAGWVITGRFARLGFLQAQGVWLQALVNPHAAIRSYPLLLRHALHHHVWWWASIAIVVIFEIGTLGFLWRQKDRVESVPVVDRRWWQLNGRRPRAFARNWTIGPLLHRVTPPDSLTVGRFRGGRLLAIEPDVHAIGVAAQGAGKTTSLIDPAILEHGGPVVTTSIRTDVYNDTVRRREQLGRVFVLDPFGQNTNSYDLLYGCEDWGMCLFKSKGLGHAKSLSGQTAQEYFDEDAEGLVAPLLHAAALEGLTIMDAYNWMLNRDWITPQDILEQHSATDALARLSSIQAYDIRQQGGLIGTATVWLKVYGNPAGKRLATPGPDAFTPERFFAEGETNTLYLIAAPDHQDLLAPIFVLVIAELMHYLQEAHNRGRRLHPSCLFALDEMANIAPLQDLPRYLTTGRPNARFLTIIHNVAQLRQRYGPDSAAQILEASQALIVLGSTRGRMTVDEFRDLISPLATYQNQNPGTIAAQAMQQLKSGRGMLIHTHYPIAFFKQRRWFKDRYLRRLARGETGRTKPGRVRKTKKRKPGQPQAVRPEPFRERRRRARIRQRQRAAITGPLHRDNQRPPAKP